MFEKYTEEYLTEQARKMGQELGVDTRQGSVFMDACAGHVLRTAKFYEDLRTAFRMFSDESCTGEVLEEKASQRQIYRKQATPAIYEAVFEGAEACEMSGNRFMADGYYFTLVPYANGYYLQAELCGSEANYIPPGRMLVPVRNTAGLLSAAVGELYEAGTECETDDSLRRRYQDAISFSAENGNKQQFKSWCEEYAGIGRAVITPLGRGENTVAALLISSEGAAPANVLVEQIQEEIDPASEGLGEGKAPIGCHFYAAAVKEHVLNISFHAEISAGYTSGAAVEHVGRKLSAYFKELALNTPDGEQMLIQYVKVVGILADVPAVKDFSGLKINGRDENIVIAEGSVGILGEVDINGSIP